MFKNSSCLSVFWQSDTQMASNATSQDLLNISGNSDSKCLFLIDANKTKDGEKRATYRPQKSSILERARNFLPQMATANKDLEDRLKMNPPESVNIEHLEDSDEKYIEMNLALVAHHSDSDSDLDFNDSGESCEDTSDTENEEPLFGEVTAESMKMSVDLKKRKPQIEILHPKPDGVADTTDQISESSAHMDGKHTQENVHKT